MRYPCNRIEALKMTLKELRTAEKIINAFESIEKLVASNDKGHFYISHLPGLSRLQKDVIADLLSNKLGFITKIHSGKRSPYQLSVSESQWSEFVADIKDWAIKATGSFKYKVPELLFGIPKIPSLSILSTDQINLWSSLFGQSKIAIGTKALIANILIQYIPSGLTAEDLANELNLSRRTIAEYLKAGFKEKIFAICFPKDKIQSVGYRIDLKGYELLKSWKNICTWSTKIVTKSPYVETDIAISVDSSQ